MSDEEGAATATHHPLEEYGLLADRRTGALVSRTGSLDWLCLPRFDSPAVFANLLGNEENGRWLMAPLDGEVTERYYDSDTFILRTRWRTPTGEALITEFMPTGEPEGRDRADLIRGVECTSGEVVIQHDLVMRFRYGASRPWVREVDDGRAKLLVAISGPDALALHGPRLTAHSNGGNDGHGGDFRLAAGEQMNWSLTWFPSHDPHPSARDGPRALEETFREWERWGRTIIDDAHQAPIRRSMLVLRALTHQDTGGIVSSPTTSLPEEFGGERNWDYRYVWLRDSALTLETMLAHGLANSEWRDWLLRAMAGDHDDLRVMYGVGGERLGEEKELEHLSGYEDSRPVRIGNGAADQYQADVFGEVMLALEKLRESGVEEDHFSWSLQKALLEHAERNLDRKDHGIWEMRGDTHHFTHGRVMMWAAFDRGIRAVERHDLSGPADRWRELRDNLRNEIETRGFNDKVGHFTQTYDNREVDASLLVLPMTGFIDHDDPRMLSTVERIEQDLVDEHGFVYRYRTDEGIDGLEGDEYPFLICCFWLVSQYAGSGRAEEGEDLFNKLVGLSGDLGLLSEEYDPETGRLAGNFPKVFSHLGLVQAALALADARAGKAPTPWPGTLPTTDKERDSAAASENEPKHSAITTEGGSEPEPDPDPATERGVHS